MGEVIVTNTSESLLQTSMLKNHIRTWGDKSVNIHNYGSLRCWMKGRQSLCDILVQLKLDIHSKIQFDADNR